MKAAKSRTALQTRARLYLHALPPDVAAELDDTIVVERPDGFYLCWKSGSGESGPFASLVEAIDSERAPEEAEAEDLALLAEAEADLGVCDWIDPETQALAEDHIPRLEDH